MFDALNDMQREMNALMGSSAMLGGGPFDLLDSAVGGPMGGLLAAAPPADVVGLPFDVVETEKDYQIHADVPGFKPADVKVTLTPDRVLTVRGKQEEKEEAEGYMMRRRSNFVRRIQLPDGVDTDHIKAVTEHGALNITIPKSEAAKVKPKEIPVHGGRA